MANDILGEFGSGSSQPQASSASCGGVEKADVKPINYKEPVGPKGINDPKTPGIHGANHGNSVNQGRH